MMDKKILFILTGVIYFGCGPKPTEPKPDDQNTKQRAEAAFARVEKSAVVEPNSATGAIQNPELVAEAVATEITDFRTGEPGWVEVQETRTFSNSVAPDNATQELLQILRNTAISKKIPASVEVSSLLTDVMSESGGNANEATAWSGFFKSTVSGVITAEEILINTLEPSDNGYQKTVRLKAYVEPVRGERDPGFFMDVKMENSLLKTGDELAFSVTPSKGCYIYVFNFMADQNILMMLPNEYMPNNLIQGNTTLHIPDPEIRKYIKFRVAALPGEELSSESIYIVCSKEAVQLIDDLPKVGETLPVFSAESQDFVKLQRWLTKIPLNQRVEKNLMYHVAK